MAKIFPYEKVTKKRCLACKPRRITINYKANET